MQFKLSALVFALSCALCVLAPASEAKDGRYIGQAQGRNGTITVEVLIQQDKIADIQIKDWSETHPITDLPGKVIPKEIVDNQTTNVDVIAGATLTSFGIRQAVNDCIKQAQLNPQSFSKKIPKPEAITELIKETGDVVVIGGGGAGISAAVAAAEMGKNVVVIEKSHYLGGNTCVAGGGYNAADKYLESKHDMTAGQVAMVEKLLSTKPKNELHAKLLADIKKQWDEFKTKKELGGLFDSPEFHAAQSWAAGDYRANLELVYEMCKMSPETLQYLSDMGLKWEDHTTQYVGALWPRSHKASNFKSGVGFIDTYLTKIEKEKLPVKFIMQTKADEFIVENGKVSGVKASGANGKSYEIRANNGIVLATGGFSANVEMRMKYDKQWGNLNSSVKTTNVSSITGDGIVMAQKIGANLIDMGLIQLLPSTDPYTGATSNKVASSTCIYVNKDGKRFVNELERRDVLSKAALSQPDKVFYVISSDEHNWVDSNGRNSYGIKVSDLLKQKKVFKGDTIEELAKNAGINATNLKESIEYWRGFCKNPVNDPFGRVTCEPDTKLDKGPYWAAIATPSVHHTMGGVQINSKTEVISQNGQIIPGLFAAGEVTGGIHGTNRVGANAIPDCLNFGRLAGKMAAQYEK